MKRINERVELTPSEIIRVIKKGIDAIPISGYSPEDEDNLREILRSVNDYYSKLLENNEQ